jgi:hypothetical protein
MLFEDTGTLAHLGEAGIPQAALPDRKSQHVLGERRTRHRKCRDNAEGKADAVFHAQKHLIRLPAGRDAIISRGS